jgi:hypothetical protein
VDPWDVFSALLLAGELVVPLALAVSLPRRVLLPAVAGIGVAYFALVWALAYRASLVSQGGDWNPGAEAAGFTFGVSLAHFLPLWLIGTILGLAIRSRLASKRSQDLDA